MTVEWGARAATDEHYSIHRFVRGTAQSVPAASTLIIPTAFAIDNGGTGLGGTSTTAPTAGFTSIPPGTYLFCGFVTWTNATADTRRADLSVNSVSVRTSIVKGSASGFTTQALLTVLRLTAGSNTAQLFTEHSAGGNLDVTADLRVVRLVKG